jgi:hypothetical protein
LDFFCFSNHVSVSSFVHHLCSLKMLCWSWIRLRFSLCSLKKKKNKRKSQNPKECPKAHIRSKQEWSDVWKTKKECVNKNEAWEESEANAPQSNREREREIEQTKWSRKIRSQGQEPSMSSKHKSLLVSTCKRKVHIIID